MLRLTYVLLILTNYRLDLFFKKHPAIYLLRILAWLNPWSYINRYRYTAGQRLRLALIKLGPIFIKFGQVLSTRPDLLPEHLVTELAKLQD